MRLKSVLLLLFLFSAIFAENILLIRDVGGSGWVIPGYTVTTVTSVPSSLDVSQYQQVWIANHGGGTGGNGEPTASTNTLLKSYLASGGKVALFCDHSSNGAWPTAVATQTGIENFINAVKIPSASNFDISPTSSGVSDFIVVDSAEAAKVNPDAAVKYAGFEFQGLAVGYAYATGISGGHAALHVKGEPNHKVGIGFSSANLDTPYKNGRAFVFTDVATALNTTTVVGNAGILEIIANFTKGATSALNIEGSAFNEDRNQTPSLADSLESTPATYDTTVVVNLSTPVATGVAVTLNYKLSHISTLGSDVSIEGNSLTFTGGESSKTIKVTVVDDSNHEPTNGSELSPNYEEFQILFYDAVSNDSTKYYLDLGSDTVRHTVQIIDDDPNNNAPTGLTLDNKSIKETLVKESIVGALGAVDGDAGDSHTFSVVAGGTGENYFKVMGTNLVTTELGANTIDYEGTQSYTVNIRVEDSFGETFDSLVTISVTPENDNNNSSSNSTHTVSETGALTSEALPTPTDADLTSAENRFRYVIVDGLSNSYDNFSLNQDGTFDYEPTSVGAEIVSDSFSYQIVDSTTYSTKTNAPTQKYWAVITITDVNDETPTADTATITVYEQENGLIDLSTLVADSDRTSSSFSYQINGSTSYSSSAGTATLTGASVQYQSSSDSLTEVFTDTIPYTVSDGVNSKTCSLFVVINPINDIVANATDNSYSVAESGTITQNVISDAPVDSDGDRHPTESNNGNNFTAKLVSSPANHNGTFTLNPDGSFSYVNDGTPGSDQFRYVLVDNVTYTYGDSHDITLESDTATVTITVTALNSSDPTARDSVGISIDENSTIEIDVDDLIDDADLAKSGLSPAEKLTVTVAGSTFAGTASMKTVDGTVISYTHGKGSLTTEDFVDTIYYTVSDNSGGSNPSATAKIIISINELNDNEPVVAVDTITVAFGKVNTVSLPTITDADLPADQNDPIIDSTLTSTGVKGLVTAATEGTVTWLSDGSFGYEPNIASVATIDSFQYQVLDTVSYDAATAHRVTAWMYIAIDQSSKDKPIATDDNVTVDEGASVSSNVMTNDLKASVGVTPNAGPDLDSVRLGTAPQYHNGTFTLNPDGSFTYDHDDSENFTDQFTYILVDVSGKESLEGTVTITVNRKNDNTFTTTELSLSVDEGSNASITDLATGLTDVDVQTTLNVAYVPDSGSTLADSVVLNNGVLTYFHNGESDESQLKDTVWLAVRDVTPYDTTNISTVARAIIVTINPVNDNTPVATDKSYSVDEGDTLTVTDLLAGVTDADGDSVWTTLLTSPVLATTPFGGVTPEGSFTYIHNGNEQFSDAFTVSVTDGENDTTITVSITITPKNDTKATGTADSYTVKESDTLVVTLANGLLLNDFDLDKFTDTSTYPDYGNTLRVELSDSTQFGSIVLNANGTFTYISEGQGIEETQDAFSYILVDSTLYDDGVINRSAPISVTITIENTFDELPITGDDNIRVAEGESVDTLLTGERSVLHNDSDPDLQTVTAILKDSVSHGTLVLNGDGTFVYTHDGSENYSDSFTYWAHDGTDSTEATVSIVITEKPPVVISAGYYDTDANGSIDQIVVEYNHSITVNATDFELLWTDDSTSIDSIVATAGTDARTVVLSVYGTPAYQTNGAMELKTIHTSLFAGAEFTDIVEDRAAPVVRSASYNVRASDGILSITLSENIQSNDKTPFTLVTDSGSISNDLDLGTYSQSDLTYTYRVARSLLTVSEGDSIFITVADSALDAYDNIQDNSDNVRQPILFSNTITGAVYLDTNDVKDGKIDVIAVKTAVGINQETLDIIAAADSLFTMNESRQFSVTGYTLTRNGFNINVVETSDTVKTAVTSEDILIWNRSIAGVDGDTLLIEDSVAPVILYGVLNTKADSLEFVITFSEEISTPVGSPYDFLDQSTDNSFSMTLGTAVATENRLDQYAYPVTDISIDYVVTGDSISIVSPLAIFDTKGNEQTQSVWAPIIVNLEYSIDLELKVFPQPLILIDGTKGKEATELTTEFIQHYTLPVNSKGVAFVVEATGPLNPNGNHQGTAVIIDNTGNAVSDPLPLVWKATEGGNVAGVIVWDAKNRSGRTIGHGGYLVAVEASVETDEGANSRTVSKNFVQILGIKQ